MFVVILLPYLGVFVYLIARGHKMSEHAMADVAGELERFADLRDNGVISPEELEVQKAKVLAS